MKYCCRFFATRQCNFVAENNQDNRAINTVQTTLEPKLRSDKLFLPKSVPLFLWKLFTALYTAHMIAANVTFIYTHRSRRICDRILTTLAGCQPADQCAAPVKKNSNCCFQCLLLSMSMLDIVRSFFRCPQVHPCSHSLPSAWEVLSLHGMSCGSGATRAASGLTGMEYCCRCGCGFRNTHDARRSG